MTADDDFAEFEDTTPAPAPKKRAPRKAAAKKAPARKASTKIPPTAKQPQDRKPPAAQSGDKARRREADGVEVVDIPITTKAGGSMVVTIPVHQGDWSVRTVQHFARNRQLDAIEGLFGEDQWEAFLELNPTMNELGVVGKQVAAELGMDDAGN